MMHKKERCLLVEGIADQSFFEKLCITHKIPADVIVATPKDIGGLRNSKQGVINKLDELIIQLNDGSLLALAIVIDADQPEHGGGFSQTISQIEEKIKIYGYDTPRVSLSMGGFLYKHNDGLPNIGVWVMPDNDSDGMLEDWIKQAVLPAERSLFQLAQQTVSSLKAPKFKTTTKLSKAEVATWLAWQKKPGEGLYYTVEDNLLNTDAATYTGLIEWLKKAFP